MARRPESTLGLAERGRKGPSKGDGEDDARARHVLSRDVSRLQGTGPWKGQEGMDCKLATGCNDKVIINDASLPGLFYGVVARNIQAI